MVEDGNLGAVEEYARILRCGAADDQVAGDKYRAGHAGQVLHHFERVSHVSGNPLDLYRVQGADLHLFRHFGFTGLVHVLIDCRRSVLVVYLVQFPFDVKRYLCELLFYDRHL